MTGLFFPFLFWLGQALAGHTAGAKPLPQASLFTPVQAAEFLVRARHAEAIADPLKRCLAYPDPPGSHWDRAAVVAYCKHKFQPGIALATIKRLIRSGHAAKLDALMAHALHEQMTNPDAKGRLDKIFFDAFHAPSSALRTLLERWKHDDPDSAFALAASGYEYEQAAFKARGYDSVGNTPKGNFQAMHTLSDLANTDLKKAVALNPALTPAWSAMIELGGMDRGYEYAYSAAQKALAVQPDNYSIYSGLIWLAQPNWFGSIADMKRIAKAAQKYAGSNPRLKMLIPLADFYRVDNCDCKTAVQLRGYAAVLQNAVGADTLEDAGDTASDAHNAPMTAIYLSEVLRFNPGADDDRRDRANALARLYFSSWAVADANRVVRDSPGDVDAIQERGRVYLTVGDLARARRDFRRATRLSPKDWWAWGRLGVIDVSLKRWNDAWKIANKLVRDDPVHSNGWTLRAAVQLKQPRPGLQKTADELEARFGSDPDIKRYVAFLRSRPGKPKIHGVISGNVTAHGKH